MARSHCLTRRAATFWLGIRRLRSRVRRRTRFINLRSEVSRFLNQHGDVLNSFIAVICYCDKTSFLHTRT
jgi:hypothetical protein